MNPVKSPFAPFCKIPPTQSSAKLQVGSSDNFSVASVEIEKPRSVGATFWRSSAWALALVPGTLTTDAAASAFERSRSVVVVTAPTYKTFSQPQLLVPIPNPAAETKTPQVVPPNPAITFLRPIIVPLVSALAIEAAKEAGKDLWKRVKQKLWPESTSSKGVQKPPSGTFTMTAKVDETEESEVLEGAPSEEQLQRFVTEKPSELYRKVQSRHGSPAEVYKRRWTRHSHISFTYTPFPETSARKTNEPTNVN